jgi:hypothetical protein
MQTREMRCIHHGAAPTPLKFTTLIGELSSLIG